MFEFWSFSGAWSLVFGVFPAGRLRYASGTLLGRVKTQFRPVFTASGTTGRLKSGEASLLNHSKEILNFVGIFVGNFVASSKAF